MKEKYEGSSLRDIANQLWLIIHGLPDEYERNLKKFSGLVGLLHFIQVFLLIAILSSVSSDFGIFCSLLQLISFCESSNIKKDELIDNVGF